MLCMSMQTALRLHEGLVGEGRAELGLTKGLGAHAITKAQLAWVRKDLSAPPPIPAHQLGAEPRPRVPPGMGTHSSEQCQSPTASG